MYNGIGLATARGSGTNGFVQKNKSFVSLKSTVKHYDYNEAPQVHREPNADIIQHEKKRQIEIKCLVLQDQLEEQGLDEEQIQEQVEQLRVELFLKLDTMEQNVKSLQSHQVHQLAAARLKQNEKLAKAFGISQKGYVEGQGFDKDIQDRIKKDKHREWEERQSKREEERKAYERRRAESPVRRRNSSRSQSRSPSRVRDSRSRSPPRARESRSRSPARRRRDTRSNSPSPDSKAGSPQAKQHKGHSTFKTIPEASPEHHPEKLYAGKNHGLSATRRTGSRSRSRSPSKPRRDCSPGRRSSSPVRRRRRRNDSVSSSSSSRSSNSE